MWSAPVTSQAALVPGCSEHGLTSAFLQRVLDGFSTPAPSLGLRMAAPWVPRSRPRGTGEHMKRALAAAVGVVLLAACVRLLGTPDHWRRVPLGPTAFALG